MGVKYFKMNFSNIKQDQYNRIDFDFIEYKNSLSTDNIHFLKNYVSNFVTGQPITKNDYSEDGKQTEYIHLVVRNIKNGELDFTDPIYIKEEKGISLSSFKIEIGDIIVAISANCGASFYFENLVEDIQFTLSHYLAKFKVDSKIINPRFLVYYLNCKTIQNYFRATETGKTQKNLSKTYLRELPILFPLDINFQNTLIEKIEPIEKEISKLKNSKIKEIDIINKVIGTELDFNWEEFERLKAIKKFDGSITDYSNNIDCRFSYKFHNKAGEYLLNFLSSKTDKKIKHFISEPIVLGKGVSPSDYDDEGDYFYIGMSNIKTWYFVPEDCKKVSESYSSANLNKTVQKNDIILARSGEGTIGKVALIEDDEILGIFADFTQRIRLGNYNPKLAYYYFRSDLIQFLVYTHKKGLGNNTNIFPSQIQEFPIPDWSENKQIDLVENIKSQIDSQNAIDKKIAEKQNVISMLIEDVINNS